MNSNFLQTTGNGHCFHCHKDFMAFLFSEIETAVKERDDLLEMAWGIIANAGGGNWEKETEEWKDAAERFRDKYLGPITGSV